MTTDLIRAIEQVLFANDPVGICSELNTDEYHPEATAIAAALPEVATEAELRKVIHGIFVHAFDETMAGTPEDYRTIARQVWKAA